ncbi:Pre-mRNA-splicing factor cwf16 [Coniosporium apollinis]|uniref:Splicing factor YJU2 n=1 Tax=Coniosporium apollinis TaxID=61459 RepID=A0ABQ9NQN0_9PEZI|nr:Pre-mRNA-splicing factor cwf16 [Coniosporium apollinis]
MSERKVLQKYYPPDFDPSKISRTKSPKQAGPKVQQVRLMAPFSMKCLSCGEYIYKGRKFNARKETTDEKYYAITIYRFYIRCTRCSAEITFKTDPKNMDYECERNARRNFEPWREAKLAEETEEERLDRLEKEESERDKMQELESKTLDAKAEMQVADALDSIRTRNARLERTGNVESILARDEPSERMQEEKEDAEIAQRAFQRGSAGRRLSEEGMEENPAPPPPDFRRVVKKKKDFGAALGIKKKAPSS